MSFEDSDHYEDDSLCSFEFSDADSVCNNWRGWFNSTKSQPPGTDGNHSDDSTNSYAYKELSSNNIVNYKKDNKPIALTEFCTRVIGQHLPFSVVDKFTYHTPIPELLQMRITFWSFPGEEEDIRLYSCLANGNGDEFQKGEFIYRTKMVKDVLQIGFHMSAVIRFNPMSEVDIDYKFFEVSVQFDRRRITSCNCTCGNTAAWCAHIVAACLYRIHRADSVDLRAPVSDSLSKLNRDQLQKFAQYLISSLPQQVLPTAQKLLDELLSLKKTSLNDQNGAPDPTAGSSHNEISLWCLDRITLHENINKTLVKFCLPTPIVFSDVNYLSSSSPPAATEWSSILRPLRGREPEGIWNLLTMVRAMFKRDDSNALTLLEILTKEILYMEQILLWWYSNQIAQCLSNRSMQMNYRNGNNAPGNNASSAPSRILAQNASSGLCDEIVNLWRLAALNPLLSEYKRIEMRAHLINWQEYTISKVVRIRSLISGAGHHNPTFIRHDVKLFIGFWPAIDACSLDWKQNSIEHLTRHTAHQLPQTSNVNSYVFGVNAKKKDKKFAERCAIEVTRSTAAKALSAGRVILNSEDSSSSEGFCESLTPSLKSTVKRKTSTGSMDSDTVSSLDTIASDSGATTSASTAPTAEGGATIASAAASNGVVCTPGVSADSADTLEGLVNPAAAAAAAAGGAVGGTSSGAASNAGAACSADQGAEPSTLSYVRLNGKNSSKFNGPPSDWRDQIYLLNVDPGQGTQTDVQYRSLMQTHTDIRMAQTETLHAHGYNTPACLLAMHLGVQILDDIQKHEENFYFEEFSPENPSCPAGTRHCKKDYMNLLFGNGVKCYGDTLISKASFICTVLLEVPEYHSLAFKLGVSALETSRLPANNKSLEVKLFYQENEIMTLLKRITMGEDEINIIRNCAENLCNGSQKLKEAAVLPISLASFIFDCLKEGVSPTDEDEILGFEASVAALGLKSNVSEADHPLLCEGTRRQRGELALTLLVHYKDFPNQLNMIMDALLDKECYFKPQGLIPKPLPGYGHHYATSINPEWSTAACMSSICDPDKSCQSNYGGEDETDTKPMTPETSSTNQNAAKPSSSANVGGKMPQNVDIRSSTPVNPKTPANKSSNETGGEEARKPNETSNDGSWQIECCDWAVPHDKLAGCRANSDTESSPAESVGSTNGSSLDNHLPSLFINTPNNLTSPFPVNNVAVHGDLRFDPQMCIYPRNMNPNQRMKNMKGRLPSRQAPSIPNQPSEASSHFMFELAKMLLTKAGGSATSTFVSPYMIDDRGMEIVTIQTHRALHLCAFKIGLYALGLHNCVSNNWMSRTYSSLASWINGQAMEIGSSAIQVLIYCWEGHLTPQEVVTLSDSASRGRDPQMIDAAASLALSALPHSHSLNPMEIQRALTQCQVCSNDLLKSACYVIELAGKNGNVYPEVLFDIARRWYGLQKKDNHVENGKQTFLKPSSNNSPSYAPYFNNTTSTSAQTPGQMCCALLSKFNGKPTLQNIGHSPLYPLPNYVQIPYLGANCGQPINHNFKNNHLYEKQASPYYNNMKNNVQRQPRKAYPGQMYYNQSVIAPPLYQQQQPPAYRSPHITLPLAAMHQNRPGVPAQQNISKTPSSANKTSTSASSAPSSSPSPSKASTNEQYLVNTYRVAMLAMDTLLRRIIDDRPAPNFKRSSPHDKDIRWTLSIAQLMGASHVLQFCSVAAHACISPFLLYELAVDSAVFMASVSQVSTTYQIQVHQHPQIMALLQRCMQMFRTSAYQRLNHLPVSEYDDYIQLILSARTAFFLTPNGPIQFNDFINGLRRSKDCNKNLYQRIMTSLQQPPVLNQPH